MRVRSWVVWLIGASLVVTLQMAAVAYEYSTGAPMDEPTRTAEVSGPGLPAGTPLPKLVVGGMEHPAVYHPEEIRLLKAGYRLVAMNQKALPSRPIYFTDSWQRGMFHQNAVTALWVRYEKEENTASSSQNYRQTELGGGWIQHRDVTEQVTYDKKDVKELRYYIAQRWVPVQMYEALMKMTLEYQRYGKYVP